jgi:hypothetical protein
MLQVRKKGSVKDLTVDNKQTLAGSRVTTVIRALLIAGGPSGL